MAQTHQPRPVKLIAGLLAGQAEWLDAAVAALVERFGRTDVVSEDMAFDFTDYYEAQMGRDLLRRFVAFERLIDPGELAAVKCRTNELEAELAGRFTEVPRPVNIDPGYVELGKLVLASAKNFSHRVYLRDGIYAEVTLQYRRGKWMAGPMTFPDYAGGRYDAFLTAARQRLAEQYHPALAGRHLPQKGEESRSAGQSDAPPL